MPITVKDTMTIGVSVLALAVSAAVAYFTIFRQTENIGIVFQSIPVGRTLSAAGISFVPRDGLFVFNNAGTRQATIIGGELFFAQPAKFGGRCVRGALWAPAYELSFDPVTLKPGDATTRPVKIKRAKGEVTDILEGHTLLSFPFTLAEAQTAEICVQIELSTPTVSRHYANVLIMEVGAGPGPNIHWGGGVAMPEDPPQVLLKKSGTIFD
jgi:hypothetical protein